MGLIKNHNKANRLASLFSCTEGNLEIELSRVGLRIGNQSGRLPFSGSANYWMVTPQRVLSPRIILGDDEMRWALEFSIRVEKNVVAYFYG